MKEKLWSYVRAFLYLVVALLVLTSAYSRFKVYGANQDATALWWVALLVCCAIAIAWQAVRAIKASRTGGR